MGAGKTTLGKAFAREMSLNFIDLDWYIEERFHKTVQQLFLERGEDGFRELERKMLHEVAEFEDVVVSGSVQRSGPVKSTLLTLVLLKPVWSVRSVTAWKTVPDLLLTLRKRRSPE